jgi:site-specific recombinase XerC
MGKIRRTFSTQAAARAWRADALSKLHRGEITDGQARKVREAATELIEGMHKGTVRTRSGDAYKPSAIRAYEDALRVHILPAVGAVRLSDIKRKHVQDIVDRLHADGKSPSTIRNAVMPLRVIYRRAIRSGEVSVNPCAHLDLPAVRGRRQHIPSPT